MSGFSVYHHLGMSGMPKKGFEEKMTAYQSD